MAYEIYSNWLRNYFGEVRERIGRQTGLHKACLHRKLAMPAFTLPLELPYTSPILKYILV